MPLPRLQTRINFERRYYSFSRCTPRCGVAVDLNRPMRPYLSLISSSDRLSISFQINDFRWIMFLNELWKTFRLYLSYGIKSRFKSFLFYSKSHFAVAKWIWTSDISRIFASFRFHKREWSSKYHTYCHNEKSVHLPQFQSDSKSGITLAPFNEPPPLAPSSPFMQT